MGTKVLKRGFGLVFSSLQSGQSRCLASTCVPPQILLSHNLQPDYAGGATWESERWGGQRRKLRKGKYAAYSLYSSSRMAKACDVGNEGERVKMREKQETEKGIYWRFHILPRHFHLFSLPAVLSQQSASGHRETHQIHSESVPSHSLNLSLFSISLHPLSYRDIHFPTDVTSLTWREEH